MHDALKTWTLLGLLGSLCLVEGGTTAGAQSLDLAGTSTLHSAKSTLHLAQASASRGDQTATHASKVVKGKLGQILFNGKLRFKLTTVRDETDAEAADLHPGSDQKVIRLEGIVRNGTQETVTVRPDFTLLDRSDRAHKVATLELCVVTLAQGAVGRQVIRTLAPKNFQAEEVLIEPGQLFGPSFVVLTTPARAGTDPDGETPLSSGKKATPHSKPKASQDAGGANQVQGVEGKVGQVLSNGKIRLQITTVREETAEESADLHPFAEQKAMRIEATLTNLSKEDLIMRPDIKFADAEGVTVAVGALDVEVLRLNKGAIGTERIRTLVPKNLNPTKLLVTPSGGLGKAFRINL